MKIVYFCLFLTLAWQWCRVFDGSWDSTPEVILSVCSLLNSSDFIFESFFAFETVTWNQQGRLGENLCQQYRKQQVKSGLSGGEQFKELVWSQEGESQEVWFRLEAGFPWSFYTHSWWAGLKVDSEVWPTQWIYVPDTKRHFLRLRASWLFLLLGKPMINTLWVVAHLPSSVKPRQSPTAVLDTVMPTALARWSVIVSVWFTFASVLISCSQMQTLRIF